MLFNRAWTGSNGLDSFGVLTAAASVTSRIRLLTAVLWPLHQPILSFPDEMANIDNLSDGHLSLGLSNGSSPGGETGTALVPRQEAGCKKQSRC